MQGREGSLRRVLHTPSGLYSRFCSVCARGSQGSGEVTGMPLRVNPTLLRLCG